MSDMSRRVSAVKSVSADDFAVTLAATVEILASDMGLDLDPDTAIAMADAAIAAMLDAAGRGHLLALADGMRVPSHN